jgi:hypothetical protein
MLVLQKYQYILCSKLGRPPNQHTPLGARLYAICAPAGFRVPKHTALGAHAAPIRGAVLLLYVNEKKLYRRQIAYRMYPFGRKACFLAYIVFKYLHTNNPHVPMGDSTMTLKTKSPDSIRTFSVIMFWQLLPTHSRCSKWIYYDFTGKS